MLRHREPVGRTLPALVVENLFYTLTVAIVITSGLAILPLVLQAPGPRWLAGAVLLTLLAALVVAAHWVVRSRVRAASRALGWLARRGVAAAWAARTAVRVRAVEDDLHAAYPHEWSRLLPVAGLELAFHLLAIAEIYLVLSLISGRTPTLLEAFLFESTNRVGRSGVQVRAAQNRRGRGGQRAAGRADRIRHRDGGDAGPHPQGADAGLDVPRRCRPGWTRPVLRERAGGTAGTGRGRRRRGHGALAGRRPGAEVALGGRRGARGGPAAAVRRISPGHDRHLPLGRRSRAARRLHAGRRQRRVGCAGGARRRVAAANAARISARASARRSPTCSRPVSGRW